jgi:hypothetical protein
MNKFLTFLAAFLVTASTFAQAPEKLSYQAVIRDAGNTIVSNQAVGMQISVLQTTATGTAVYVETQTPTTNENGLVSIEVGTGSTSDDFSAIDWSAGPYFIKTETDPTGGSGYTITGTSELLSVPYALHAKTVTQPTYNVNTLYPELGGYVIEVNSDGSHGLVVAMQDQGFSNWYEANDLLSNASNHDTNGAKFKDWRLPTKRELNLMYVVYINGNGATLNANFYWSSTEDDVYTAWLQDFFNGVQYDVNRSYTYGVVRAVRAF